MDFWFPQKKKVSGDWDLQRTKQQYWSDKRQQKNIKFRDVQSGKIEPIKTELK